MNLKTLLPGILIGVVAVLAVQYGMASYQSKQVVNEGVVFMQGYDKASDKAVFVEEFATKAKDRGFSVSVSTSSADEGGCYQWYDYSWYYFGKSDDAYWAGNIDLQNAYLAASKEMHGKYIDCLNGGGNLDY